MLQIGTPKVKILSEIINGKEFEGVTFKVESISGLSMKVSNNAKDDTSAKALIKKIVAETAELKNMYTNIQIIDENGRII